MKKFSIIGITTPEELHSVEEESAGITGYLVSSALDLVHIRKPEASVEYTVKLMDGIPSELHGNLILHSHYNLWNNFKFGGIHLKGGIDLSSFAGMITRSCHSLEECKANADQFSYSFLSPVFDSISKPGYPAAFSLNDKDLLNMTESYRIVALGGVRPGFFSKLFETKFAGAALLGYLWSPNLSFEEKIEELKANKEFLEK